MARPRRAYWPVLALVMLLIPGGPGTSQTPPGSPDAPTAFTSDIVKLPSDSITKQKYDAAREYIREGRWSEAVRLLQTILDLPEDVLLTLTAKPGAPEQRLSARAEAERMLAELPAAGLEFYRATQNGPARRLLADARRAGDLRPLEEIARRYRFTDSGADALEQLGLFHLEHDRADLAASCFRRLLDTPRITVQPRILHSAALVFHAIGDKTAEETTWKRLSPLIPKAGLVLGSRTLTAENLRQEIDQWPVGSLTLSGGLYRGDERRSSTGHGDIPLLEPRWQFDTTGSEASRAFVNRAIRAGVPTDPILPGSVPIAREGRLFYHSARGIHAIDLQSGRELWQAASPLALESLLRDPGRSVQLQNWLSLYQAPGGQGRNAAALLYENLALGTLSCDGRYVYHVEDLPLQPNPNMALGLMPGRKPLLGPLRTLAEFNRIRALDVLTGEVAWEQGGPTAGELAGGHFLGPPLPVGARLYALMEKGVDLSLICLNSEGDLVRRQKLAGLLRHPLAHDPIRWSQGVHLAHDGGILVCSTNAGVIFGVDLLTMNLLWTHIYRDRPRPSPVENALIFDPAAYHAGWRASAAVIHQGRVLMTAPDAEDVRCLDLKKGSLLWKSPRSEDDLYLAGAFDGRVLLIGKTTCRALSLERGQPLWSHTTGTPSGLGAACGAYYYLPLRDGPLFALHLQKPQSSVRIDARGQTLGNLLFHDDGLWSQTPTALVAYSQVGPRIKRLTELLALNPRDPAVLEERGGLHLNQGDLAGAVADLQKALSLTPNETVAARARARLFDALTQFLERDFAAAEKYLDDYRQLCQGPDRGRMRRLQMLVARGRASQGRVEEAITAYRDLLNEIPEDELLPHPEEPTARSRPDIWIQERVAEMAARLTPEQQRRLLDLAQNEWNDICNRGDHSAAVRFLSLYGGLNGQMEGPAREARFWLAEDALRDYRPLAASGALAELRDLQSHATSREIAARALRDQAELFTRYGAPEDAAEFIGTLANDFADVVLRDGRSGAAAAQGLAQDKRLLAVLNAPPPAWDGHTMKAVEIKENLPEPTSPVAPLPAGITNWSPLNRVFFSEWQRAPLEPLFPRLEATPPKSMRALRLHLSQSGERLHVAGADGSEGWSLPLGVRSPSVNGITFYSQQGALSVLLAGSSVFAVDLAQRRVCWSLTLDGFCAPNQMIQIHVESTGLYIQGRDGLTALDLATGHVRWARGDVAPATTYFSNDEALYLLSLQADGSPRTLRGFRVRDGKSFNPMLPLEALESRQAFVGRCLLWLDRSTKEVYPRLTEVETGKDLLARRFPEKSLVLVAPDARQLAVMPPDGNGIVFDLVQRREIAKVAVDPKYLATARGGFLIQDRERIFLAFDEGKPAEKRIINGPMDNFAPGLGFTRVFNGRLYAFDRVNGELRWFKAMPLQGLLLARFDELPVVLCSSTNVVQGGGLSGGARMLYAVRTLDKRTGKVCFHRDGNDFSETYHSLLVDPISGKVDLLSSKTRLHHFPQP